MPKQVTREQAQRKKAQAAEFLERIGQPDRAEEFSDMTVDEYAEHKGLRIVNPAHQKRSKEMSTTTTTVTKADLQDQINQAIDILDDAYAPESTREDLAAAVGNALDVLRGEGEDEEDEDEDTDDDDLDDDRD